MAGYIPKRAISFIIGSVLILAFIIALFCAAIAIYTKVEFDIVNLNTYAQAWNNLILALRNIK